MVENLRKRKTRFEKSVKNRMIFLRFFGKITIATGKEWERGAKNIENEKVFSPCLSICKKKAVIEEKFFKRIIRPKPCKTFLFLLQLDTAIKDEKGEQDDFDYRL